MLSSPKEGGHYASNRLQADQSYTQHCKIIHQIACKQAGPPARFFGLKMPKRFHQKKEHP
jgi:hypothetical protein